MTALWVLGLLVRVVPLEVATQVQEVQVGSLEEVFLAQQVALLEAVPLVREVQAGSLEEVLQAQKVSVLEEVPLDQEVQVALLEVEVLDIKAQVMELKLKVHGLEAHCLVVGKALQVLAAGVSEEDHLTGYQVWTNGAESTAM